MRSLAPPHTELLFYDEGCTASAALQPDTTVEGLVRPLLQAPS